MLRICWITKSIEEVNNWLDERNVQAVVVKSEDISIFVFDIHYALYRHSHPSFEGRVLLFKPNCHGLIKKSIECHGNDQFPISTMHDMNKLVDQLMNDIYIPSVEDLQLLYNNEMFFTLSEWEIFYKLEF